MTKIGMIGGLGPTATLNYYKAIIDDYKYTYKMSVSPEIIIYSMDNNTLIDLIKRERWSILISWLMRGIKTLHFSGAGFAFIAGTTPHIIFDELQRSSPIPLISIVDVACHSALKLNVHKVGLLGTTFTMQNHFYQTVFEKKGLKLVVPDFPDQQYIHHKMTSEIDLGVFSNNTQNHFLEIINQMKKEKHIEAIILGCTKVPSFLNVLNCDIPFINTLQVHVDSILEYYMKINNR